MAKSRRSFRKSFILEPILTPSSLFDTGFEDGSDVAAEEGFGAVDLGPSESDDVEIFTHELAEVEVPEPGLDEFSVVTAYPDEVEPIAYVDSWFETGEIEYIGGVFTVGESGYVSIDYLFDGGKYDQGELAIFSLEGMTQEPGSRAFIQEAAWRALSSSELGYVVISDATDGARFSNTGGVDFNTGEYAGVRTFKMNGGDRFGFMLAPNHSIQQVYNGEAWRPIFSMATANPDDHFQFGQIADLTGDGTVFTLEDISLASGRSDRDYDDIVFQMRGATGYAPHVEEVIAEGLEIQNRLPWDDLIDYVMYPPELDLPSLGDFNVIYSDRFFNPTESFSLIGLVDQADVVERVEVWARGFEGDWLRLGDVEDFSAEGHYRFDYGAALDAGHYEVKAIAFYPGGEVETITPVTVLSLDEGVELSHRVKAALTRSVELGSYDLYALAQTTDWVLSVRSGTDLAALATQLGVAEFEPTGIMANTYQVNFGSGLSATQVQALINGIESIEYGVPLIREQVYYHSPTNDPLAGNQWYLNQGGIYDAWATHGVSGQGITMGILDDGFAIDHPDLVANYRADLSWDFDERDNDPSPTYAKTLSLLKYAPDHYFPIEDLPTFPNLLHLFNFYRLPFSNVSGTVQDLTLNFTIEHQGDNPLQLSLHRYDAGANLSQPAPNTILIPSPTGDGIGTGSYSINLTEQLQGWSVEGLWALSIQDLSPLDGNGGFLQDLSLNIIALNSHGTAVTGVATAVGDNSIGIVGVAPDAQWVGIRAGVEGIDSLTAARALTHNLPQIDLYNNSWGLGLLVNSFLGIHALEQASRTQGTPYIFSGGNNRTEGYNVNYGTFANSPYTIAVGAVDGYAGKVADYSAPGAALFISAYSSGSGQGVTTTDVDGGYRDDFGGTSAAAPVVSGVVALLLEANPNLNWRDIQHILAQSADRTAINDPNANWSGSEGDAIRHSHDYGFGLIDPVKAVELAKSWEPLHSLMTISQGMMVNQRILDHSQSLGLRPVQSTITVEQDITVESVEILFNGKHGYLGDLEITLISPSGERSILAQQHQGPDANRRYQNDDDVYYWTFSSFHHWGESSQGEWTLEVVDKRTGNLEGFWTHWSLNINGFDPNSVVPVPPKLSYIDVFGGATQGQVYTITYDQLVAVSDLESADGDVIHFKIESVNSGLLTINGQSVVSGEALLQPGDIIQWTPEQVGDEVAAFKVQAINQDGLASNSIAVHVEVLPEPNFTPQRIGEQFRVIGYGEGGYGEGPYGGYSGSGQYRPAITVLEDGKIFIAWQSDNHINGRFSIYGSLFDQDGNKILDDFQINSYEENHQFFPLLTPLKDGGLVVAWISQYGGDYYRTIFVRKLDSNGQFVGEEFQINMDEFKEISGITALNDGGFVITLSSTWDLDLHRVFGQRFDANVNPVGGEFLMDKSHSYRDIKSYGASVASFDNDEFVAVWTTQGTMISPSATEDGSGAGIFAQRFDAEGNFLGERFQVNTYTQGHQQNPKIVALANGEFFIVWESEGQDGSELGVFGQKFSAQNNPIGEEFQINTFTLENQHRPSISSFPNGSFIVTWVSEYQDGTSSSIFGQYFDQNGNHIGEEFQVNMSQGSQYRTDVSVINDREFMVVWTSELTGETQSHIFAQRFTV